MELNLGAAYDVAGFRRGSPEDFVRVVSARDASVGLNVEFPEVGKKKIVYRLHTDPFPGLKDKVAPKKLASTYMDFNVRHLLGEDWHWWMSKDIWHGGGYTEYAIAKKDSDWV